MQPEYPIDQLCRTLAVTRSGYHAWAGRTPGPRAQANAALLPFIEAAHQESRQTYGAPRVHRWLRQRGHACGRHRIARLMRAAKLRSHARRRFRPMSLTDSNHDLPIAPNRLRELTTPSRRDAVWVADITYVPTDEGWLYVAGILDRCTRRCIGWAMGQTLATALPLAALEMALAHRQPPAGLVHHSDRGVQYASENYRQRLAQAGVIPSMSRRGNCDDNALMESFWSTMKRELIHRHHFATRAQARAATLNGSKSFTTGSGSTAPSASNHLWTLKPTSTKYIHASCTHTLSTHSGQGQYPKPVEHGSVSGGTLPSLSWRGRRPYHGLFFSLRC